MMTSSDNSSFLVAPASAQSMHTSVVAATSEVEDCQKSLVKDLAPSWAMDDSSMMGNSSLNII